VRRLQSRAWPGNIRELRNAVERVLILASGKTVTATDIENLVPPPPSSDEAEDDPKHFMQDAEKSYITLKLQEHDWNVAETARALKMPRSNLYKKIERFRITREIE